MRTKITGVGTSIVGVLALAMTVAGCGDDDTTTAQSSTSTTAAAGGAGATEIDMGDYFYDPKDVTVSAGPVTITAPNVGDLPHELVLAKTDDDPADLPTVSDGSVDEEQLDVPGEIPEIEAGESGTGEFDLAAGSYVMFCNIPGHYAEGMYGSLTAK